MNEPPGARARVALTGLTVAEYFRDQEGQDVLLFIDNIFRYFCRTITANLIEVKPNLFLCLLSAQLNLVAKFKPKFLKCDFQVGLHPSKMIEVVADRDVWLLPSQPSQTWASSEKNSVFIRFFFFSFSSEMAGLLVAWLSTTPPYFATRLMSAATL